MFSSLRKGTVNLIRRIIQFGMDTYKRFRYPSDIISHAVWLFATRSRLLKLSLQECRGPPVPPGESRGMNQELP